MEFQNGYEQVGAPQNVPDLPKQKAGFAVASLVLGIISLICCCCGMQFIAGPLALIFGIIALLKKLGGRPMAIAGVSAAGLSLILTAVVLLTHSDLLRYANTMLDDFSHVLEEQDTVFPAYEENGSLPDYLLKYTETPYVEFLEDYDSSIYVIMDALLQNYKNGELPKPGEGFHAKRTQTDSSAAESITAPALCIPVYLPY